MLYSSLVRPKTNALDMQRSLREHVSRIGFGGAAISGEGGGYGFGNISESDSVELLHASFDHGINLYDTAPVYGYGLSEERIGRAFSTRRDKVYIVSKGGVCWQENKRIYHSNEPKLLRRMLDESLKRLKTDYLDLYLIHWPDSKVSISQTLEVLVRAQEEGKLRDYGLCNYTEQEITKALTTAPISVVQHEHNPFKARDVQSILSICSEHKLGFMGYGTFDKGVLTGHVTKERETKQLFSPHDFRSWAPWWKREKRERKYQGIASLESYLKTYGHTLLEYALYFALHDERVSTALCGIRSIEQLNSIIKALDHLPTEGAANPELLNATWV